MDRFHIVVLNHDRVGAFLANFERISNFDPLADRIIILDCSENPDGELQLIRPFLDERRWLLGTHLEFRRRRNWGGDQGARIELFRWLCEREPASLYLWQFQDHYLDTQSHFSIWPLEVPGCGGKVKGDVIPEGVDLDLAKCDEIFRHMPSIATIYADRNRIGVYRTGAGQDFFAPSGGNFAVRTSTVRSVFNEEILACYECMYDGSYSWQLFMELEWGRRLTDAQRHWYDLVTDCYFASTQDLEQIEASRALPLRYEPPAFYGPLFANYEERFRTTHGMTRTGRTAMKLLWNVKMRLSHLVSFSRDFSSKLFIT